MGLILCRIFYTVKVVAVKIIRKPIHTWHIEALFVALVLSSVAIISGKGLVEWIGVGAVFFTWMHVSVANRLEEVQAEKVETKTGVEIECFRWTTRFLYIKECLWVVYFVVLGAWSALAGSILFLFYGWWRVTWRKFQKAHNIKSTHMQKKIVLGSQSKSRTSLLDRAGMHGYETMSADIDEKAIIETDPWKRVLVLAHAKAGVLIPKCNKDAILITSDCIVYCNGEILEKPESKEDIYHFFDLYSRFPVSVISSVVVTNISTEIRQEAVKEAKIVFSPFTAAEIEGVAQNQKNYTYSGGFTIEDPLARQHVVSIEGDESVIIGLPMEETLEFIALFNK